MTYVIAEIGQNHNGCEETARKIINEAKRVNCDAVKFTIRDLDNEMTESMASKPYKSCNSYGETYMEHREYLELSERKLSNLCHYAYSIGLDLVITMCSSTLFDNPIIRDEILPICKYIKVASRDITNFLLIDKIALLDTPIILSSGLSNFQELTLTVQRLVKNKVILMHCVSKYPTMDRDANLIRIQMLRDHFKAHEVGYSDHTIGYEAVKVAVALGATIIEKHITLDPLGKGSDHICSADPETMRNMVREIKCVNQLIGNPISVYENSRDDDIDKTRTKLMRSVCTSRGLRRGEILGKHNLCLISPGDGIPANRIYDFFGKAVNVDIPAKSKVSWEHLI